MYFKEMVATRSQMSGQINVEVDAAPQQDLTSVLQDIRYYYETVALKNRRELEGWFKGKVGSSWYTNNQNQTTLIIIGLKEECQVLANIFFI